MENSSPLAQPSNSQAIFAALRDVLAALYPEETDARVVVADAGLDAKQILFSARAQTNWHNILAEAARQERLDPLLKIVLGAYAANSALLAAYGQYRLLIDQGGYLEAPAPLPADAGVTIGGDVNLNQGDFVGRDKLVAGDDVSGDQVVGDKIDAHDSQGFLNRPAAPVTQHFGTIINIGALQIPIYLVVIISVCIIGIFSVVAYPFVEQWLPPSRAFAAQANGETLIVIATFHNTAATNSEAHTKIRRAIADTATTNNEQQLRVEVEPTELNADQRPEAEALGKRYNASMVIWGEDTGVEVIVNFLNLKGHGLDAALVTITERERTQLTNPSAYARFITHGLPQEINFYAFFAIGQSYYINNQYSLAIEQIEAAVALVPPNTETEGLAEAYFRLGWLYQMPPEKLDEALASYDKAIQLNPDYTFTYINRGYVHSRQGKLDEAIADYDKAIQLNPNMAVVYINRGAARDKQIKLDEAIADYDKAIQLDPGFIASYINRGVAHKAQGKLDEAIADYDRVIQLDPDIAAAYYYRGNVRYDQGKLDEAIADYDQAIALNPNDVDVYVNRGNARYEQGKLEEAITDYNQAIALKPNEADTYYNRGIVHSDQRKLYAAIADFNNVIQINPEYANAFRERGLAYQKLDKPKEALADFRRYLELQPNAENRIQVEAWITEAEVELAKLK